MLARMNHAGSSRALSVLLIVAATVALSACGSSASNNATTVYASCLHKQFDPASVAAHVHCQTVAQQSCPKGVLLYTPQSDTPGRAACGLPRRVSVKLRRVAQ
jgi:hypothetical protein